MLFCVVKMFLCVWFSELTVHAQATKQPALSVSTPADVYLGGWGGRGNFNDHTETGEGLRHAPTGRVALLRIAETGTPSRQAQFPGLAAHEVPIRGLP